MRGGVIYRRNNGAGGADDAPRRWYFAISAKTFLY